MAFQPGQKKTGGRKRGSLNKRTQEFLKILEEQSFCPVRAQINIYRKALKNFKEDRSEFKFKYLEIAGNAAKDLTQYAHPKRKAIEHTGKDGEALSITALISKFAGSDEPEKN